MIESLYEKFKPWSEKGSIYIISDTHFDDSDCRLIDKHWISPEEQIEKLKCAHRDDTLIILGDVGNAKYLKEIKAYKVLIKGNHDVGSELYKPYFNEIYEGPLFIGEKILISHEPIPVPFALNIHGHDHAGIARLGCLNVAANIIGYSPISLKEVIKQGYISNIPSLHRIIINCATERKNIKEKNK